MTAIVGLVCKTGVWLGADRCVSDGAGNVTVVTTSKLFRLGDCLCGTAGDVRTLNILHTIDVPRRRARQPVEAYVQGVLEGIRNALKQFGALKIKDEKHSTANALIIATSGRLFGTDGAFAAIEPVTSYYAIGAGAEYALGAIHALTQCGRPREQSMVREALAAAAAFRRDVSPPFDLEFQPGTKPQVKPRSRRYPRG